MLSDRDVHGDNDYEVFPQCFRIFPFFSIISLLTVRALAVCLSPPGDVSGDGKTVVSDVQCTILMVLWSLGGEVGTVPTCLKAALSPAVIPDHNCDHIINVVDVLLSISFTLGITLDPISDANQNLCVDACETDLDGDGDPDFTDCAPANPMISKTAAEKCNGYDDNCDGIIDLGTAATIAANCSNGNVCDGIESCQIWPPALGVIVDEIMVDPSAVPDAQGEWIELFNGGLKAINIRNWTLLDGMGQKHVIDPGGALFIPAGGYMVLGRTTDMTKNGGALVGYHYNEDLLLGDTAGTIILLDDSGVEIDRVEYAVPAFPVAAGVSMALSDASANNNIGSSWTMSKAVYGAGDKGTPQGANADVAANFCLGGQPLVCSDMNDCTDDSCDPSTGCKHEQNNQICPESCSCNALLFDGSGDYVELSGTLGSLLDGASALTMEAWIFFDEVPVDKTYVLSTTCSLNDIELQPGGFVRYRRWPTSCTASASLSPGAWHHVAAVTDVGPGSFALFIDGVLACNGSDAKGFLDFDPDATLEHVLIGSGASFQCYSDDSTPAPLDFYHGSIRGVRYTGQKLYSTPFTPPSMPSLTPSTLALYGFCNGNGTTLVDSGPSGLDGVIHNATWLPLGATCGDFQPPCDDANPCTIDIRSTVGECSFDTELKEGIPCDDGNSCTQGDTCIDGSCIGSPTTETQVGSLFCEPSLKECPDVIESGLMVPIPAETFIMGCEEGPGISCEPDEQPAHTVTLGAYAIDMTEVTVAAYSQCITSGGCPPFDTDPKCSGLNPDQTLHPANCVTWAEAEAFCQWACKRLCTEAEFENAARGSNGAPFPWGEDSPSCEYSVMWDTSKPGGAGCGTDYTFPVKSKPAGVSPEGAYDLAGNAWEWVSDWYDANYYEDGPIWIDPKGPSCGTMKILRGGGAGSTPELMPAYNRSPVTPAEKNSSWGFRCCASISTNCNGLAEGSPCDDGNLTTTNDKCQQGTCAGTMPPTTCETCGICWDTTFDLKFGTVLRKVIGTPDGGVLAVGRQGGPAWAMRFNPNWTVQWDKVFQKSGLANNEDFNGILALPSGDFLGVGALAVEFGPDGVLTWSGPLDMHLGRAAALHPSGGYVVIGDTPGDIAISYIDAAHQFGWKKSFGKANLPDQGFAIKTLTAGGFVVMGHTSAGPGALPDGLVFRIGNDGAIVWEQTLGGIGKDFFADAVETADGNIVITGGSAGSGQYYDIWLVKLSQNGDVLWNTTYGGDQDDHAWELTETCDGGFLVAGVSESSFVEGTHDGWLIRYDSTGSPICQAVLGGPGADSLLSIVRESCSTYIIGMDSSAPGSAPSDGVDLRLVKVTDEGHVICEPPQSSSVCEDVVY